MDAIIPFQDTPYAPLWVALLLLGIMLAGYLARQPAHALILAVSGALRRLFRILSTYCGSLSERLQRWTGEMALTQSRAVIARRIRWEHERLRTRLESDLADMPELRRRLVEQIADIDEAFRRSAEPAPEPPAWAQVTDSVARLAEDQTGQVSRTLEDIRDAMAQYRADARESHRRASYRRYLLLYRMMPRWRRVQTVLENLEEKVERLQQRLDGLLDRLQEFDAQIKGDRPAVSAVVGASVWRWLLSAAALSVAAAAIVVLGSLVVRPMQAMMGDELLVFGVPTYLVIASILVFFKLTVGLVMVEALRLSDVFPSISALDYQYRRLIFWSCFGILLLLASVGAVSYYGLGEAGLVASQGALPFDGSPLLLVLSNALQALMVFLLPFVLALAALPLAVFGRTTRPVMGIVLTLFAHLGMLLSRLIAVLAGIAGTLLVRVYDLAIFLPLWVERIVTAWLRRRSVTAADNTRQDPALLPAPAAVAAGRVRHEDSHA